jgi:hypothetical protein
VEGAIERRRLLRSLLEADGRLSLLSGPLHLLAFRPHGLDAAATRRWSLRTRQDLLRHQLMLSRPCYQGLHHLKAVLGNPHTRPSHLRRLVRLVQQGLSAPDPV